MMNFLLQKIIKRLSGQPRPQPAADAYDLWALTYDDESGNLLVILDEMIFSELLRLVDIRGKHVADIGCGTGRHWSLLYAGKPAQLTGYDVSAAMLERLAEKYPGAVTRKVEDHLLNDLPDQSGDLLVSTLALAHFDNIEQSFTEWNRVVRPGGDLLITDYHPEALEAGGDITFRYGQSSLSIRCHMYTIERIRKIAAALGWEELQFAEKKIDATMKHFYEAQQALTTFHKFDGVNIIYGLHFRKSA